MPTPFGRGVRWYLGPVDTVIQNEGVRAVDTLGALPPVRPEEHLRLVPFVVRRTLKRPTEDDLGIGLLALVEAAAQWNGGKRPCPWGPFAAKRIRWEVLYRFQLASADAVDAEVPLFLPGEDDEDDVERWEMAVEDPRFREAEARADVRHLLDSLEPREREVLELRYGLRGEPATLEAAGRELGIPWQRVRQIQGKAVAKLRKRARRGTFTIPLDSENSERLR